MKPRSVVPMREFDTTALQRTREPGGRAGFTLVELLVTLIILSTGIVLVLQAFETSAIALSESRDAMRADWLIRQKLAAMTADPGGDEAGGGSFPPPYNAYQWRASRHAIDRNGYSLEHLTVSVWRQDSKAIYAESTLVRKED